MAVDEEYAPRMRHAVGVGVVLLLPRRERAPVRPGKQQGPEGDDGDAAGLLDQPAAGRRPAAGAGGELRLHLQLLGTDVAGADSGPEEMISFAGSVWGREGR